jgi:hypothetical protein
LEEVVNEVAEARCDMHRHGGASPNMLAFGRERRPPPGFASTDEDFEPLVTVLQHD